MALLREADAVDAAARAALPTPEEERVIIDAAETLAGSEAGVPAKSRAVVLRLESKWCDFLERHGEEYGWDERLRASFLTRTPSARRRPTAHVPVHGIQPRQSVPHEAEGPWEGCLRTRAKKSGQKAPQGDQGAHW